MKIKFNLSDKLIILYIIVNSFVAHGVGHDSGANAGGGGGVSIAHSVADGGTGCGALRVTTSSTDSASASSGGDRAAITANSVNASMHGCIFCNAAYASEHLRD